VVPHHEDVCEAAGRVPGDQAALPGVLSDDSLTVLFTHPGDAQWTEVIDVEHLEEAPD